MLRFAIRPALLASALLAALLVPTAAHGSQRIYFAGDGAGGARVSGMTIGLDGALDPVGDWPGGATPLLGMSISPDGESIYVASSGGGLRAFAIGTDGTATALAGDAGPSTQLATAVTPDGRFVYATETGGGGGVRAWSRSADGSPQILGAGSDYAGAAGLAMAPDGRHLFATSVNSNGVRPFTIGADGTLTPGTEVAAGPSPVSTAMTPDGRFLYVGAIGAGSTIRTYSVAADGALSQVGAPQPTAGDGAYDLLASPDGRYLYVADGGTGGIGRFTIAADGDLTQGIPDVPTAGSPFGLATDAAGRYLYAADADDPRAFGFSLLNNGFPAALVESPFADGAEGNLGGPVAAVPDQPPVAAFTTAVNNRRVSFDAAGTVDPEGDRIFFSWEFGDGSPGEGGMRLTHRYGKGKKLPPVTLTTVDGSGCSTAFVSGGRTPYCNGSSAARVTLSPFAPRYLGEPAQKAKRTVRLRLRCAVDCRVKVVGRVKLSGKGLKAKKTGLKGTTKRIAAGERGTLKLKLSPRGADLAAAATRAVARLKVSATDDAGNLFKDRHGITLR